VLDSLTPARRLAGALELDEDGSSVSAGKEPVGRVPSPRPLHLPHEVARRLGAAHDRHLDGGLPH
jgi:hypothetical protein